MSTNASAVAALSIAGIVNAQIFGMTGGTIALATGFTLLGVMGRIGFEIAKTADTSDGVKWSKVAALFAGGCCSSVAITVLYLSILKLAGVQSDGALVIGLVFFGFSGPRAILWLLNTAASFINKRTGLNIPLVAVPPSPADGAIKP